jgi:hypothetical protein
MLTLTQNSPAMIDAAAPRVFASVESCAQINAPWRYSALAQLRNLQEAGRNLPGIGDLRISEATSDVARQLLAQIDISDLPVPQVAPISGGGVSSLWVVGSREVQLMVFSDGDVLFQRADGAAVLDDPEGRPSKAQYISGFNWLLGQSA